MLALARFARAMLDSRDLDPVYPVLRQLHDDFRLNVEERIWHTFLYLAYYSLPTAHAVWNDTTGRPFDLLPMEWAGTAPTGIERRNLRHPDQKARHLGSYAELTGGNQLAWWLDGFTDDPVANWHTLQERTQLIYGNGRWAAYKMGDLARYVLDWPVQAADTGMRHSSGPRQGICLVYDLDDDGAQDAASIAAWEVRARHLQLDLYEQGHIWLAIDQVETLLCDWKSLVKGRYYVGHDIDLMLADTVKAANTLPTGDNTATEILSARRASLPPAYLGELHGWADVDAELKRRYRDHGDIWTRPEWQARRRHP